MVKKIIWAFVILCIAVMALIVHQAFGEHKIIDTKSQRLIVYDQYEKNPSKDFPSIGLLKNGDILLRRGYGVDSTVSMNFSQGEKRYSHAGIIQKKDDGVFIIHSEEDKDHGRNGVYIEPIKDFLDGIHIWAVYRFDLSPKLEEDVISYALKLKSQNIIFDIDFNLNEDNKMYCSEFIYKVINRTTGKELIHAGKHFVGKNFVTISDLYQNNSAKLVDISHNIIKRKECK
jgi:hypothetical protein